MKNESRICIIGAGAIGGVLAALLAQKKHPVQLVVRQLDLARRISQEGIRAEGACGSFIIPVPTVSSLQELQGTFNYILVATKADGLMEAARTLLPFLDNNSRVVSLQNGICEEMLAGVVGAHRTIGCVVGFGATMHEPGRIEMTSGGELIIGNWNREPDPQLDELARILNDAVPTRISEAIFQELYSKLIINACITTLGAISGQYLGELLVRRSNRNLFIEIIREAIAVARAMGINVPPGASGKLDYYRFLTPGLLSGMKRHLVIRVIGMKYRKLKSSSLQSLERGQKTEVDNYNGYLAVKGQQLGVPTPVNEQLTRMVREIEQGTRKIAPANLREIR